MLRGLIFVLFDNNMVVIEVKCKGYLSQLICNFLTKLVTTVPKNIVHIVVYLYKYSLLCVK